MRARRLGAAGLDALDAVRPGHHQDGPLPPRRLRLALGGELFRELGERTARDAVELADLSPGDRVLDIGCGAGRVALALTRRLGEDGSYEGFDPAATDIRWCRRRITPRHPSFRFRHIDLANAEYNPGGGQRADEFRFPYPDDSFDVAIASSVFTHLLPAEVAHYLRETARVLRPGGRLLATFFLVNESSRRRIEAGDAALLFAPREGGEGLWALPAHDAEVAVGLEEGRVRAMHAEASLAIREPIRFGTWSGEHPVAEYQDTVVSELPPTG
ncbi:MAG: class I SAM-dependent methyltransferase [Actinobacteria bacterium]|nr:class I SAM-dependent methyltransferase [Actinomycetota bacterium]